MFLPYITCTLNITFTYNTERIWLNLIKTVEDLATSPERRIVKKYGTNLNLIEYFDAKNSHTLVILPMYGHSLMPIQNPLHPNLFNPIELSPY
jgi:hypothetical protein